MSGNQETMKQSERAATTGKKFSARDKKATARKPDITAKQQQQNGAPAQHGPQVPHAVLSHRASDRLRADHLWVYATDVVDVQLFGKPVPNLLPVADERGFLLGTALYSPESQIALRLVSREFISESEWFELLERRLRTAIQRRKDLLTEENDSARLCFSEADELPGLIADKYGDLIVLQLLVRGLDNAEVRKICAEVLRDELAPATIVERPDPRIRELEGLPPAQLEPLYTKTPRKPKLSTTFHVNGLQFEFDANAGQKTGAFLDQRANYLAAADWAARIGATGRALDICTYQGGFALHLARVAEEVTGVDSSRASLEIAERNLEVNRGQLSAHVEWVAADAFELLREWAGTGERFDVIILDPPAFAKSKRAVEGALRGYKELNLRALEMLNPGGLLVTCTCSHHITWADLEASLASAACDTNRRVRLLERRGAALDHPVIFNLPETEYLKAIFCQVD
jgi:23S rRNA (cytosine1962-C5)-methyltransferase